eukprot:8912563-Pyramimonas_sp.AAC.1
MLIPKHKQQEGSKDKPSYRGIGLMSSIWGLWANTRQPAARRWEFQNKRPYLAHQGGRGILET